ncbi:MAG TPA: alpha-amylase family glycosyl hydrolase [Kofleriaceae bacterium]|nr:alpha-amylase family glycosyl hydrolase [Kofleriaceae bacterium]
MMVLLASCTSIRGATLDAPTTPDAGGDAQAPTATGWAGQVIYLVMPDRFVDGDPSNDNATGCYNPSDPKAIHGGDYAGLRAQLPYLAALGVTAVWITPAYLQTSSCHSYHGYWADFTDPDDGAIAPNLGTAQDLAGLAADLHALGMRLILDMVVNHTGSHARIDTEHPDWFHDAATCSALGDPAIYCPVNGLPDFAQEDAAAASYLSAVSAGWVTRFPIDGIRMDTVHNVLPGYWAASWFPAVRQAHPGLFVVGEDYDESGAAALAPFLADGFDSLFDYPRYGALIASFAQGGSVDALASAVGDAIATYGLARACTMTSFVDNHDNPRLPSLVPSGTSDADATARYELAQGASFTLPGIPQLMWGDEIAMLGGSDPDNRRDMPAWAFTAAGRAGAHAGTSVGDGQAVYAYIQQLIAVRRSHTALQVGSYGELWRQNGGPSNVLAFFRGDGGDRIVVAINAGGATSVALPIAANPNLAASDRAALGDGTTLHELLGAGAPATVTVAGGAIALALPAQTIGIYAP